MNPARAEKNRPGNFFCRIHEWMFLMNEGGITQEMTGTYIFAEENLLTGLVDRDRDDNRVRPWVHEIMQSSPAVEQLFSRPQRHSDSVK
jgi:hypothetical protein